MKSFLLSILFVFIISITYGQDEPMIGCHQNVHKITSVPGANLSPTMMDDTRSDSIDILNYTINIDLTKPPNITANTIITAEAKVNNIDFILLDLLDLQIDSVFIDGTKMDFSYDGFQFKTFFPETKQNGESIEVHVYYQGKPSRDPSGFGGLVFEDGYFYNLGIGLASNPHNFGRGWFPCFDNFMERSTFEYNVLHSSAYSAHCVGTEIDVVVNGDGTILTSYAMDQQITTYQSSIAVSNYEEMWSEHEGAYGTIPIKLVCKPEDTTAMKTSFGNLNGALDCMESWFGPHVWERVGYVATTVGAMEHPTNIAYPISSINGNANSNTRLMSHELAHNWFGNLITLTTERDMWIKEGPAEYGWHLTAECIYGHEEFLEVVQDNHLYVLEKAHIDDEEFRALSGMPNEFTYGTHTYRKGASVIHNLRGYLGDEEFSTGMKAILDNYAYSHLDAQKFEEVITNNTSVDASDFFEAWILNPGFSVFVVDSILSFDNNDGTYDHDMYIQQKLRGTDVLHKNVPLSYTLVGFNDEKLNGEFFASDKYTLNSLTTDFPVKRIVLNGDNRLNQARMAKDLVISETGNQKFDRTDVTLVVNEETKEFEARVEHIWASPDQNIAEGNFQISNQHYWIIDGEFPDEYEIGANFPYVGNSINSLDYGLTEDEDSVLLFYRTDASDLWEPLYDVEIKKTIPNDGKGLLRLSHVQPGEYTIGKGELDIVKVSQDQFQNVEIYPNPTNDLLYVYVNSGLKNDLSLNIFDINGMSLYSVLEDDSSSKSYFTIDVSSYLSGTYFVEVVNMKSGNKVTEKFVVLH